jgi:hypothetical protein
LELRLAKLTVVQPDDSMVRISAELRNQCERTGHGLGGRLHDGDRWVAATAIRLGLPLVSHDRIFVDTPGVDLLTLLESGWAVRDPVRNRQQNANRIPATGDQQRSVAVTRNGL